LSDSHVSALSAGRPHSGSSTNPIAIFVATRWELQAVRRALATDRVATIDGVRCHIGQRGGVVYWLVQTGVGPLAAGRVARKVLAAQPMSLLISTGFICALEPAQVGDLIVGTEVSSIGFEGVVTGTGVGLLCDDAVRAGCYTVAKNRGMAWLSGPVISVSTVVWQAEEKRRLRDRTQAIGLDMESGALATVAYERTVPMVIVRTVSDLAEEDLPLDFNLFLRPTGWMLGIWALVRHPSSFAGLSRLGRQSRMAADRLTEWFRYYADSDIGLGRRIG